MKVFAWWTIQSVEGSPPNDATLCIVPLLFTLKPEADSLLFHQLPPSAVLHISLQTQVLQNLMSPNPRQLGTELSSQACLGLLISMGLSALLARSWL